MTETLLTRILERYGTTRDFNGLYLRPPSTDDGTAAIQLVRDGLVEVVSEEDYPNPHIRPWPSRRTIADQVASIEALESAAYGLCLYPTARALTEHREHPQYLDQPFREAMAQGRGSLELAYFSFDVLEQYRNDPRFSFAFDDFGARTVVSDASYRDANEPEHDKIIMSHIGFAYDLSHYIQDDSSSPIVRRVCAFYGDLAKLSPTHQQRWKTYEITAQDLEPHPAWWGQQMGHWSDGIGPFERLLAEMDALSELHERAFGKALFRTVERPRELGWILRPSQQEWDAFVHQLDKLLSENLQTDALDAAGAPSTDGKGQRLGTVNRLAALLAARGIGEDAVQRVLAPWRSVRKGRQYPAHALRTNVTDSTFVHKQVELLAQVTMSVSLLRQFWQKHSANLSWVAPEYLAEDAPSYRM